jgi:hypothetical protein
MDDRALASESYPPKSGCRLDGHPAWRKVAHNRRLKGEPHPDPARNMFVRPKLVEAQPMPAGLQRAG